MLVLSKKIEEQAVLSLRTGGQIATTTTPIINPNNFLVVGFFCYDTFNNDELVLVARDIREHIKKGFVVDDHEVLVEPDELVRMQKIISIGYEPKGKLVVSDIGRTLGRVSDYAVDSESLYIQKIYVTPRLLKGIAGSQLSIDRKQIVETTDKKIVVKDSTLKLAKKKKRRLPSLFGKKTEPAGAHPTAQ